MCEYDKMVERIARMMARDNDDEQHWGVYATRAMEIIDIFDFLVREWEPF